MSSLRTSLGWLVFLGLAVLTPANVARGGAADEEALHLATFDQVWTTVRDRHPDSGLGGVDWEAVRDELRPKAASVSSREELRPILQQMLNRLGQSHLTILPGEQVAGSGSGGLGEESDPTPPGEQVWDSGSGFGVRIEDGRAIVAWVTSGSEVADSGVAEGWTIDLIGDGEALLDCEYTGDVTVPLLTADGESVIVEFGDPVGEIVVVEIPLGPRRSRMYQFPGMPPQQITVEAAWLEPNIGYLTFNWFFDPVLVMSHLNRSMEQFMDADGIIIDMRGNSGGMGSMATALTAWFVADDGLFAGTTISRDSVIKSFVHPRARTFEGKVAVLIDQRSGSAAEIFAATMRDLAGARLFGRNTMGAVLPAAFDQLPNGDYLQYVIANYVTCKGEVLEGAGVKPDEQTNARRSRNREEDRTIQAAIEWMTGEL